MTENITYIYKGDDTGAFGNNFITITLTNEMEYTITKAQFVVNDGVPYCEPVENPTFPMVVNFTSEQTEQMKATNVGRLWVWDEENQKKTCKGQITWDCKNGVIFNGRNCC